MGRAGHVRKKNMYSEKTHPLVVVEEVLAIGPLVCFERALELLEEEVELLPGERLKHPR